MSIEVAKLWADGINYVIHMCLDTILYLQQTIEALCLSHWIN